MVTLKPLVSIVMPVYNCEKYLDKSIKSILNQTFRNFEFIIINDGSTDKTGNILEKYEKADSRIHIYNSEHQGVSLSLNKGCGLAQGKYIARMDADDISLPERIAKEVEYMEAHPEIGILGTGEEQIDEGGSLIRKRHFPVLPGFIKWSVMFGGWCLSHPTVMMRQAAIKELNFYNKEVLSGQDYELWSRAIFATKISNIQCILIQRRIWSENFSYKDYRANTQTVIDAMHLAIRRLLGREISEEITVGILQLQREIPPKSSQYIKSISSVVQQMYSAYIRTNSLSFIEAVKVSQDAQKKLRTIAVWAGRFPLWERFPVFIQVLRSLINIWIVYQKNSKGFHRPEVV